MLQNYFGQKFSSNQWPIILGAGLYTTCRGERLLVVIRSGSDPARKIRGSDFRNIWQSSLFTGSLL